MIGSGVLDTGVSGADPGAAQDLRVGNVLSMGTGSGEVGGQVVVALSLENEDEVKALQTDIAFDAAILGYVSGEETGRGSGMNYSASVVDGNKVRVILYYDDASTLSAGSGAVANLTFSLLAAGQSALTPASTILSDPQGEALSVTNEAGSVTVTGGGGGGNVLSMGTGSGEVGGQVVVALSLENEDEVKALQTDIAFDAAILGYVSGEETGRGSGMNYSASVVDGNKVRVILYYDDASTLSAGSGAVANLTFSLLAAGQSALTPASTILSDPQGEALSVTNEAGSVTVTGEANPPTLWLNALKNPGRTRTVQVFVLSNQDLTSLVVTAGGQDVTMSEIDDPLNLHQGIVHVAEGTASVTITATGSNKSGEGNAETTVTF